jgi:DNA-binding NarL/FixJ family response regulator
LAIAERTVEAHLTSMFEKAQVETRAELVVRNDVPGLTLQRGDCPT